MGRVVTPNIPEAILDSIEVECCHSFERFDVTGAMIVRDLIGHLAQQHALNLPRCQFVCQANDEWMIPIYVDDTEPVLNVLRTYGGDSKYITP